MESGTAGSTRKFTRNSKSRKSLSGESLGKGQRKRGRSATEDIRLSTPKKVTNINWQCRMCTLINRPRWVNATNFWFGFYILRLCTASSHKQNVLDYIATFAGRKSVSLVATEKALRTKVLGNYMLTRKELKLWWLILWLSKKLPHSLMRKSISTRTTMEMITRTTMKRKTKKVGTNPSTFRIASHWHKIIKHNHKRNLHRCHNSQPMINGAYRTTLWPSPPRSSCSTKEPIAARARESERMLSLK